MTFRRSFLILGLMAGLLFGLQHKTQLVVASSQSLPNRVYLVLKGSSWQRDDIVTIQGHAVSGQTVPYLTKHVRGIEGDSILEKEGKLYVNTQEIGSLHSHTSTGKPLHPISLNRIPRGQVFVAGNHPKSFDSRYQEFGLVKVTHIVGRSIPLW